MAEVLEGSIPTRYGTISPQELSKGNEVALLMFNGVLQSG
jgi:hypothetical protein